MYQTNYWWALIDVVIGGRGSKVIACDYSLFIVINSHVGSGYMTDQRVRVIFLGGKLKVSHIEL